ncbi:MAG: adenine nucleotide alpha hydrolase family protein [Candidatus Lokiarchaeota archaeon]|nr:adenine nucleotide alpha hydrolase family protein [Candidatus Lokiarchaeota archaeon]
MQSSKKCSKCGKNSVYFQKSSGISLCNACFIAYFERKFQKTVSKYIPLHPTDVVCVALSGGKDSIALLYNLYLRCQKTNGSKIFAITVDEGISTNFKRNQQAIVDFFNETSIDIELIQVSYKNFFGRTMDEIVKEMYLKQMNINACTVCASIRRRILNEVAKSNRATKIAIGHNLDDLAQTFLMNILRNDLLKIENIPPHGSTEISATYIPRIKPLFLHTENEIQKYCIAKNLPFYSHTCEYAIEFPILRRKVKFFLDTLDERSYEFKYNLIKLHLQLNEKPIKSKSIVKSNLCSKCLYPTGLNRTVCTYCELKSSFGLD